MRTLRTTLAALALAALLTSPALAQGPGRGGFGGMMGGPGLLSNAGVQKELNLDAGQIEKADKLAEANRAKFAEHRSELEALQGEERQKKTQEIFRSLGDENQKALAEILKPEQAKRFHQIQLQQAGPAGLAMPRVQAALKLTDDQKDKIRTIERENAQEMREIFQSGQGGNREEMREKITAHRKATMDKILGILGDEQKKSYHELLGSPFEVKFERRPQP